MVGPSSGPPKEAANDFIRRGGTKKFPGRKSPNSQRHVGRNGRVYVGFIAHRKESAKNQHKKLLKSQRWDIRWTPARRTCLPVACVTGPKTNCSTELLHVGRRIASSASICLLIRTSIDWRLISCSYQSLSRFHFEEKFQQNCIDGRARVTWSKCMPRSQLLPIQRDNRRARWLGDSK